MDVGCIGLGRMGLAMAGNVVKAVAKYTERMAAMFGTPEQFTRLFSAAVIITPTKPHA